MTNYIYNGSLQENITFNNMVSMALRNQGGPQPFCKQPVNVIVEEGKGEAVPLNGTTKRYAALDLFTCAAVIFASAQSDTCYFYHAKGGTVPQQAFNDAMAALGKVPAASIYVIYTFPKKSDANYLADARKLISYGVPDVNIIYAPDLMGSGFGITSETIVG